VRILFWGTPEFAVPSLRALDAEGFDLVGVVTQPDRPAGRGRRLRPSAVRHAATELGLPVFTPETPRTEGFTGAIRALRPDLSAVVAYGHILQQDVLDLPRLGSINLHASLLPELRGAAPINWAIARGHAETGVTIMRMVQTMDAGPIILRVPEPILPEESAGELSLRLSEVGAAALVEALLLLDAGVAVETEQDHAAATFAPKVDRSSARIDWSLPAREVASLVRGMDPVPGAWAELEADPVKLFRPSVWSAEEVAALEPHGTPTNGGPRRLGASPGPGRVLVADAEVGVLVATGDGGVAFFEAQPPGKRRMSASDWVNGRGVEAGQRFA
jgi:methionyl-tRNA formyltransferase